MHIATTHRNSDFDALASLVAATFLYPHTIGILPSQVNANVREFLSLHQDLFHIFPRKGFNIKDVSKLIIVDANNWKRLDGMQELSKFSKSELEVHVWDHHLSGADIDAAWESRQEIGANITQMVEEMQLRDCAFAPMHATLFLMGIYEDTGNLTYPSTTSRDAAMAAFLLENGADLNVANAYLASSFDAGQTDILTGILEQDETFDIGGYKVAVCKVEKKCGPLMLAPVVSKYSEIKKVDAVFGVFRLDDSTCVVIARSSHHSLNIAQVVRALGGGGHPGAGSAMVKGQNVHDLYTQVVGMVAKMQAVQPLVKQIMSPVGDILDPDLKMEQAKQALENKPGRAAMVVKDGQCLGLISGVELSRARKPGQLSSPVKGFMNRNFSIVGTEQSMQQALQILSETGLPMLPVVQDGQLLGKITRTDLMLQLYELD